MLVLGSAAMAGSGLAFVFSRNYTVLLLAATFGVISPSGNEVGPCSSLETAMLSQLTPSADRVFCLMYYQLLGFVGLAFGSLAAGQVISHLQSRTSTYLAYRSIFAVYAVLGLVKVLLCAFLTEETELWKSPRRSSTDSGSSVDGERQPLLSARPPIPSSVPTPHLKVPVVAVNEAPADEPQLAPASPSRLSLCLAVALFGIDAFASSLTPTSYIALFLQKLHHAPVSVISTVFAGGALCAVLFSLGTGALVKRIGLVLAMVTTHIPAQVITGAIAFAPTLPGAISLIIARTSLSSMDSSIRGALLASMVPPEARTRLLGIVDVTRTLAATPGPFVTGRLVEIHALKWTFVIGGGIKILCDSALLVGFRRAKLEH
ncbi:hypothetical protein BMF94_4807 [Rhodotorula taiwanensis]|uniref:Major facilitator superfamily (MFS) profile domain-containing protein n=1 Tax=Rhodotorula taiwanensis TaxID=741276 RepID=A0A2S5B5V8_9BASI|nr:hypothetical protein BMF94_4807 [Rhodotorula taiwanensis]